MQLFITVLFIAVFLLLFVALSLYIGVTVYTFVKTRNKE